MSSVSGAKSMTNALSAAIVTCDKLPRTKVWGETDSAVSWQGAFEERATNARLWILDEFIGGGVDTLHAATKMKSPALAPRLQVPSALMAPAGSSVASLLETCRNGRLVLD